MTAGADARILKPIREREKSSNVKLAGFCESVLRNGHYKPDVTIISQVINEKKQNNRLLLSDLVLIKLLSKRQQGEFSQPHKRTDCRV